MKPLVIDGSRHKDEAWYALPTEEMVWRDMACRSKVARAMFLHPDVVSVLTGSTSNHAYGYRYLEPEHLLPPWTPELLLAVDKVSQVAARYKAWSEHRGRDFPAWAVETDKELSDGERLYAGAIKLFEGVGLQDYLLWAASEREKFRKRVAWATCDHAKWKPFQVDINSPSLFLDVTGPDVWQVIVDTFISDGMYGKDFVANMQMASLDYVMKEIPGPHGNPYRKHDPDSPLGYGVSTAMPSFGYRREHRSETRFAGWVAAAMPEWDLLGDRFWPAQDTP